MAQPDAAGQPSAANLEGTLSELTNQLASATNDRLRVEGEAQILRSRLETADKQAAQERQRAQRLEAELLSSRAQVEKEYEARIQKLQTDISFKNQVP